MRGDLMARTVAPHASELGGGRLHLKVRIINDQVSECLGSNFELANSSKAKAKRKRNGTDLLKVIQR